MKKIILFTKMSSIQKHWEKALFGRYNRVHIDCEKKAHRHFKNRHPSSYYYDR